MATIPVDPGAPSPPSPVKTKNQPLNMVAYSDKSFVVFGESTRIHKESLGKSGLGGSYNPKLKPKPGFHGGPGYIFYLKLKDQVRDFVNQVNAGTVATQTQPPLQGGNVAGLPTVVVPIRQQTYQWVKWKVFRPAEGMKVTIKVGGGKLEGVVLQTETTNDIVDTAYISASGNTSKVVICSGKWQIFGYMADHTVFFSSGDSPNSPNPTDDQNEDYGDLAGI